MLKTVTEFALGCDLVLGLLMLLAGMGDSGQSLTTSWAVELLPLSGFVVVAAAVVGIRTIRATPAPRRAGVRLLGIAVALLVVAVWIELAAPSGRGLGSVLAITALPPLAAGLVGMIQAGRGEKRSQDQIVEDALLRTMIPR